MHAASRCTHVQLRYHWASGSCIRQLTPCQQGVLLAPCAMMDIYDIHSGTSRMFLYLHGSIRQLTPCQQGLLLALGGWAPN